MLLLVDVNVELGVVQKRVEQQVAQSGSTLSTALLTLVTTSAMEHP